MNTEQAKRFITKLKQERHYAGNHDAHDAFKISLDAIFAQQQRDRFGDCGYCKDSVYYDVLGSPCKYNFCPMCGRMLAPVDERGHGLKGSAGKSGCFASRESNEVSPYEHE